MTTVEELCADNRKLVDMNLKLRKKNKELKEQNANLIAMLKSEREVRVNDDYLLEVGV